MKADNLIEKAAQFLSDPFMYADSRAHLAAVSDLFKKLTEDIRSDLKRWDAKTVQTLIEELFDENDEDGVPELHTTSFGNITASSGAFLYTHNPTIDFTEDFNARGDFDFDLFYAGDEKPAEEATSDDVGKTVTNAAPSDANVNIVIDENGWVREAVLSCHPDELFERVAQVRAVNANPYTA